MALIPVRCLIFKEIEMSRGVLAQIDGEKGSTKGSVQCLALSRFGLLSAGNQRVFGPAGPEISFLLVTFTDEIPLTQYDHLVVIGQNLMKSCNTKQLVVLIPASIRLQIIIWVTGEMLVFAQVLPPPEIDPLPQTGLGLMLLQFPEDILSAVYQSHSRTV